MYKWEHNVFSLFTSAKTCTNNAARFSERSACVFTDSSLNGNLLTFMSQKKDNLSGEKFPCALICTKKSWVVWTYVYFTGLIWLLSVFQILLLQFCIAYYVMDFLFSVFLRKIKIGTREFSSMSRLTIMIKTYLKTRDIIMEIASTLKCSSTLKVSLHAQTNQ